MVYFIRQNETVKIGFTSNIKVRLADLQGANPYVLSVILVIDGGYDLESELHTAFQDSRVRGEWYLLDENIREYIASMYDQDLRYEQGLLNPDDINAEVQTKFIRNKEQLTLREVGERLGKTKQGVKRTETSEMNGTVTIRLLREFAEALGYELQYKFVKVAKQPSE